MKKKLFCLIIFICYLPIAYAKDSAQQDFETQAHSAIKDFQTQLKTALLSAMKAGGPVEAIAVCKDVAPTIAQQISQQYNLDIRRTSLKVRNPDNQADAWETAILKLLQTRLEAGEPFQKLVFSEHVTDSTGTQWRMLKAIPTSKVCLTCHGSKIAKPVQAKLNELYPDDQATGFKLGDIRGAFSVKQQQVVPQ